MKHSIWGVIFVFSVNFNEFLPLIHFSIDMILTLFLHFCFVFMIFFVNYRVFSVAVATEKLPLCEVGFGEGHNCALFRHEPDKGPPWQRSETEVCRWHDGLRAQPGEGRCRSLRCASAGHLAAVSASSSFFFFPSALSLEGSER